MTVAQIFEAETGNRFDVKLVGGGEGMEMDALRRKLFSSTGVPPENQILLFGGPPYKPLRTTLPPSLLVSSPEEAAPSPSFTDSHNVGKKKNRVYLFDWRTLAPERSVPSASPGAGALGSSTLVPGGKSGGGGNPAASYSSSTAAKAAAVALEDAAEVSEFVGPVEVELPAEAGPAPSPPSARDSGLLKTIANCGRYSLSALNRGEAYLEASCRRLRGGEVCVERMGTQMDALEAAVSNSLDHWEPLQRGYSALKEKLEEQASRHEGMLETFERDLSALGDIPLHPSLATNPIHEAIAVRERTSSSSGQIDAGLEASRTPHGGSGGGGQGLSSRHGSRDGLSQQAVKRVTLLDCVPVEREHKLLESCRTSQRRFGQEGKTVAQKYAAIKRSIEELRADPVSRNCNVDGLFQRARDLCREQESLTAELRSNYSESFQLASKENWADDQEKQDAIRRMTELMATQENIVPTIRDNDQQVRATVVEIARAKAALSQTLRRRLREVSRLQTDIGKIQKHQELVRIAWEQKEEQFDHLGKVASMPAAYKAFLREVARRRRYHQEAEAKVEEFCRSMSSLRSTEIAARESFRQTHLGNLPPVFVQMAPGLRNMPPVFTTPQVTPLEPGELPEVSPEDETDTSHETNSGRPSARAAGTEEAPEAPPTPVGRGIVGLHAVKANTQAAARAETEEEHPAKTSTSAGANTSEGRGDDDEVVVQDEPAPAEEIRVEKEVVSEEGVQAAAAEDRKGSHPTRDGEEASPTPLEAENALLVVELAEARARLEELEARARAGADADAESATAAARAAPLDEDSAASTKVSAGRGDEAASSPGDRTSKNVSTGRGDEAVSSPGDKTSSGGGQENSAAEAKTETEASPTRQIPATDDAEGEDVATVLRGRGRSGAKGKSAGAAGAERRRRSVSDEVVDAGRDSAKPASERRGSGLSREATQKQLVAYRTGLSMLVKLCNQLTAASTVTAAGVGVGAPRADASTASPVVSNTPPLSEQEGTPPGAGAAPPAESSRQAEQSAEPSTMATHEPDVGVGVAAGGVSAGAVPEAAVKEVAKGKECDHGEGAGKRPLEATEHTQSSKEVAAASTESTETVTTATVSEAPGSVEDASKVAEGGEKDDSSARLASAAEDRGGAGKPGLAAEVSEAEGPGTTATAASQAAEGTVASPSKATQEPSPAERGPGDVATAGADAEARETAVVRSASRGVDKIKRASERVAVHIRRSHSRIEELLAFEAMASVPRISMCSFSVQDIALFLPTMVGSPKGSSGTVFLAFHVNCPNRYLSEESVNTARQDLGSSPAFILGRIIMIEQQVATEEPNPYNVASNTVYYVLTAENLC